MTSGTSPFVVKVLNSLGQIVGPGPITTIINLNDTRELDTIGTLTFTMPANDPIYSYITAGSQFDIYDVIDGYIGRYIFKNDSISETKEKGTVTVQCYSIARELVNIPTGFRRQYLFDPVENVVANLMGLAPAWTSTIQAGIGNTTVSFEGESVLSAINALGSRWNAHTRLTGVRNFEFGLFGADSGLRVLGLEGQVQAVINAHPELAIVKSITKKRDGDWIVNTVIPMGSGQGVNQLTIEGSTAGIYSTNLSPNFDGTHFAYIQDGPSVVKYGVRLHQVSFPQITPLSNNATDILRAKDALKLTAQTYMLQHLEPSEEYDLVVNDLRWDVKVGDKIHVKYTGTDRENVYLNIDADFYILSLTRARQAGGERTATFKISSVQDHNRTDTDVMLDLISDVRALKVYYQPTAFRESKTYVDSIANSAGGLAAYIGAFPGKKPAVFALTIDETVTSVTKVLIHFKTYPAFTSTDMNVTTPVGNATSYEWNTTVSLYFPKYLHLYIDGVDVSDQYGGPWNSAQADLQTDVELDITSVIVNAPGGLFQEHSIIMVCYGDATGDGRVNTSHPSQTIDTSFGNVEMTIVVLGSATGIIST